MRIGAHVSAAGGVWNAPSNAAKLELETFQIFSRPPQGGPAPKLDDLAIEKFKLGMKSFKFTDFVIHAPYFTNLGSANPRTYYGTISVLKQELERGNLLGASYVMFHPGSFKEVGDELGMKQVKEGVEKVLEKYDGTTQLLIEISAGAGSVCGDTFEELQEILEFNKKYLGKTLGGICFDTQHAFAAGYDLKKSPEEVFEKFDKITGLEYLKVLHANDSLVECGAKLDRHHHLDVGKIGQEAFLGIAQYFKSKKISIPWILETKHDRITNDIAVLKGIKKAAKLKL